MPTLTVIIPAYNEAKRLPPTLRSLATADLGGTILDRVIVVDDGSTDGSSEVVTVLKQELSFPVFVVRGAQNRGKGRAVKMGLSALKNHPSTDWALIADADESTPWREFTKMIPSLMAGNIAIGSRGLSDSVISVRQPGLRHRLGTTLNLMVRFGTGLNIYDTQCGFKALLHSQALLLAPLMSVQKFAWDIEFLMLARDCLGLTIDEIPVHWEHREDSRVRLSRDGFKMLVDLVFLLLRWRFRGPSRISQGNLHG